MLLYDVNWVNRVQRTFFLCFGDEIIFSCEIYRTVIYLSLHIILLVVDMILSKNVV